MADIRDLGASGKAVFDTAQKLQKANLIDDAQFKELTNDKVGPQDIAISNKALDALKATTPDAMNIMMKDIPGLNKNILGLQTQALQKTRAELAELQSGAAAKKEVPKAADPSAAGERPDLGTSIRNFLDALDGALKGKSAILNIRG